jgi:hypothetical protein
MQIEQPPLVGEVSGNLFADRGCHVVGVTDLYDRILRFLDRSRYLFFQVAPGCTQEAEWTLFQTHYFSGNLVAPEIEPGPLDQYPGTLSIIPQRRSTFFYITYINSLRTSQEA